MSGPPTLVEQRVVPHYLLTSSMLKENPNVLNVATHLSSQEQAVLEALLAQEQGKPSQILLMENHHAHGSDSHRGAVYVFPLNERVAAGAPFAGSRFFNHVLTLPLGDGHDERVLGERLRRLVLPAEHSQCFRLQSGDSVRWQPSLGRHGNFVRVCKHDRELSTPSFYLEVHTDSGAAGQDFYEKHIVPGKLTFAELIVHPDFLALRNYSHRNARRVLALAMRTLELPFVDQDDCHAHVEGFEAPPRMAVPLYDTCSNTFHRRVGADGKDVVAFYSQATALDRDVKGPGVSYLVSPLYGSVLYKGVPHQDAAHGAPFSNEAFDAFPTSSGPLPDVPSIDAAAKQLRSQRGAEVYAERVMHWQDKKGSALQHPHAYKYRGYTQGRLHEEALNAREGSMRLHPVAIYQAPPAAPLPATAY